MTSENSNTLYKILSLDGGGSWAFIEILTLMKLFPSMKNKEILKQFDMVVTNSGGSIVLAGMIEKETPEEVFQLLMNEEKRRKIFVSTFFSFFTKFIRIGHRYKTTQKLLGLQSVLSNTHALTLDQIPGYIQHPNLKLLIVGFDYDRSRASFFRSDLKSPSSSGNSQTAMRLADAVHASSNAPVNYFNGPTVVQQGSKTKRFWDGAIGGHNNPCLVGCIEALSYGKDAKNIRILSLGTGATQSLIQGLHSPELAEPKELLQKREKGNFFSYLTKLSTSILNEPQDAASYMAHMVLGGKAANQSLSQLVRLNPIVRPVLDKDSQTWKLPKGLSYAQYRRLQNLDMDAVKQEEVNLIQELTNAWLRGEVPNQAIRMSGTFEAQIGHDLASEAIDYWKKISQENH
ncbi:MAG: patatin-like phospholipase family protein [Cytophagaceae bacterium]|jgi:patatin-like phospholipase/acyl hydrolase|nr:patatin-like phospholipase family protein [Cytophagaceae bacterium]